MKPDLQHSDAPLPGSLAPPAADEASAPPPRVRFGGLGFDNVTLKGALARIVELIERRRSAVVITPNVDHVIRAQEDRYYAELVAEAELVLADGQPIVWGSRLAGRPLAERVAGSDVFPALCGVAAERGYRVFFLGGAPGAAEGARDALQRQFPELHVAGTHCPPFGFEHNAEQKRAAAAAVEAARADIVFVGLGSPKQERWIAEHRDILPPAVYLGIGISFGFVAGQVRRAPRWMQRAGLEWLHRVCQEPRRLAGRYFVRGWSFMPVLLREIYRGRFSAQRSKTLESTA